MFGQLSPPVWEVKNNSVYVTLFGPKPFKEMTSNEKIRACFQHCALQYAMSQVTNNRSLRERFSLAAHQTALVSSIIDATEAAGLIKIGEEGRQSTRYRTYVPYWA